MIDVFPTCNTLWKNSVSKKGEVQVQHIPSPELSPTNTKRTDWSPRNTHLYFCNGAEEGNADVAPELADDFRDGVEELDAAPERLLCWLFSIAFFRSHHSQTRSSKHNRCMWPITTFHTTSNYQVGALVASNEVLSKEACWGQWHEKRANIAFTWTTVVCFASIPVFLNQETRIIPFLHFGLRHTQS